MGKITSVGILAIILCIFLTGCSERDYKKNCQFRDKILSLKTENFRVKKTHSKEHVKFMSDVEAKEHKENTEIILYMHDN